MLDLLAKLLGPHRAVTVYAFLQTRALAIVAVLALLAGGTLFALAVVVFVACCVSLWLHRRELPVVGAVFDEPPAEG